MVKAPGGENHNHLGAYSIWGVSRMSIRNQVWIKDIFNDYALWLFNIAMENGP